VIDDVGDELHVGLRLVPAAHDAEGAANDAVAGFLGPFHEPGNDRVERTLPRRERIGMRRVHREQPATALQHEARTVGHQAGSEVGEVALNERDHVAGSIDHAQTGRVAAVCGQRARRNFGIGVRGIDLAESLCGVRL